LKKIQKMDEMNINSSIYFALGLPFEKISDFKLTLLLYNKISKNFKTSTIKMGSVNLEPGSLMYEKPERYRIKKFWNGLESYYEYSKLISEPRKMQHPLGYETEHFSEDKILALQKLAMKKVYLNWKFVYTQMLKFRNLNISPRWF